MSTAVAPPGPIPGAQTPSDTSALQPLSWEGDKMFNIYIYDYCFKRGFRKTARELLAEAEIPSDSTPPINARQGLLFEWWSVFWVLFTAKANGNGTDDAMLYTQHQAQQFATKGRQSQQSMPMPGQMGPQQPLRVNGVGVGRGFPPNGVIPNGIPPGGGPPAAPTTYPANTAMPNGIMPGPPPPGMGGQQPFNPQRPLAGQTRPSNGIPPFQSPTMAHSPPSTGQLPQPPHGQSQPPMAGLPQRGPMLPPGQQSVPYPMNMQGRPPSRTSTPQSGMMNSSPSLTSRQPILQGGDQRQVEMLNHELQAIPPGIMNQLKIELGYGDKVVSSLSFAEKQRLLGLHRTRNPKSGPQGPNAAAGPSMQAPPPRRNNKRNSNSPGEDQTQPDDGLGPNGTSPPDRKRLRRSPMEAGTPLMPGTGYPQGIGPTPQLGGPGGLGGPAPAGGGGPQPPMGNGGMMTRPMSGPMGSGFPPGGQPGMGQMGGQLGMMGGMNPMMPGGMSPQMHPQGMMQYRQQQGMHLQPGARMPGAMNAGSPGADPSFNPGGMPMPPGMGPGLQGPQSMQPGGPQPGPGQQFTPGNRLTGPSNQKPMSSMLPPPSPAKDQNAVAGKDGSKPGTASSPRNQPLSGPGPNAPGTAPPTPAPTTGGPAPGSGPGSGPGGMAASPGMMINPNPSSMNPVAMPLPPSSAPGTDNLFSSEFIQSVANGLDDFDVGIFRGETDINFERDFGQWFNPDEVGLDLNKQ